MHTRLHIRLAHFSDIHCTTNPLSDRWSRLFGKRSAGCLNYFLGGRGKHFRGSASRIEKLLEDADRQNPDHVLCTGDVTQMSFDREFEICAGLFGPRLNHSERYTVLPGNHDRYTTKADAERRFEKWFGSLCAEGKYPFVKPLGERITLVGLDPCRSTSLVDSSGLIGVEQLSALQAVLSRLKEESQFVIVALHYGVFRKHGNPDKRRHGLRDFEAFAEVVEANTSPVRMVLHGHLHGAYRLKRKLCTYLCAGSATDLYGACGYNVYDINAEDQTFRVARRAWSKSENAYELAGSET